MESVIEKEKKREEKNILACPICYSSLASISQPNGLVWVSLVFSAIKWLLNFLERQVIQVLCFFGYRQSATSSTQLQCNICKRSYSGNETHLDLVVASGSKQYSEPMPLSTELFRWMICFNGFFPSPILGSLLCGNWDSLAFLIYRTPLVSFLYERGWRQNFVWGGFPGPEKEVSEMKPLLFFKGLFFGFNDI